jgi:hypothetical protein
MKYRCPVRSSHLWIFVIFASVCAFTHFCRAADYCLGTMKANRILILGNSITLHSPAPGLGWPHNCGMAASAQNKDYVHRLVTSINAQTGGSLLIDPTPPDFPRWYPGDPPPAGDANVINIADLFERNYATWDNARIQQQLDAKPDIVVLQFGENLEMGEFNAAALKTGLQTLMTGLKSASDPNIFVTGFILGSNAAVDVIKREVCAQDPSHRVFVNLSAFGQDAANFASAEPYYQSAPRVLGHPGDKGMTFIADKLFDAMKAHSAPEPGCSAMLVMAVLSMAAITCRRRTRTQWP